MMKLGLDGTVEALLAPGKGILAADESSPTLERRFRVADVPFTEESRRSYREMLFTAPGLCDSISGVILFDETIRQSTKEGVSLLRVLAEQGIIAGIKVDKGTMGLPGFPGQKLTLGLDGLRERLAEYRGLGARFTKWRAVISIDAGSPTRTCLEANARALALFAALSQEAELVPIVEPEVLMDGAHTLGSCEAVTREALGCVFDALAEHEVVLEQMLLKTGMVLPGAECIDRPGDSAVTAATLRCLRRTVPPALPGVVFLSGGQGDLIATKFLNSICQVPGSPWRLSFSFGRALQAAALKLWNGAPESVAPAQQALVHRARCNALAVQGRL